MKYEWRRPQFRPRMARRMVTVLLMVACVAAVLPMGSAVRAVDLSQTCALTVQSGSEELDNADVAIDLYLVAEAREIPGGDSYTYAGLEIPADIDNARWRELAQEFAKERLSEPSTEEPYATAPAGQKIENLEAGLYLVVARGTDLTEPEDYVKTNDDGLLVTLANTDTYQFSFQPELVSLPGKPADDSGVSTGDWIYDQTVTLKPERSQSGSLEIIKILERYETSEDAIFVFDVEATLNGQNVYSNVVSINFTGAGQKSVLIEDLPVGAQVTVTEVYSGAHYQLTTAQTQTATITAGAATVTFNNDYDGTGTGGHGATNHFTRVPGANGSTWDWTMPADSTAQ